MNLTFDKARGLAREHGTPLLVLSRRRVLENLATLSRCLPGVRMHYAVKANPHPQILRSLAAKSPLADIASPHEIEAALAAGFPAAGLVYSNPVRRPEDIRFARQKGVEWFIYDSRVEMEKLSREAPGASALLRIRVSNPSCVVDLSYKYGADPDEAEALVADGLAAGLKVRGLAFHVGSQASNPYAYVDALVICKRLANLIALRGVAMDTLDIGGGFPVTYVERVMPIERFCEPIASALESYFSGVQVIAEPGRFIAADAVTLVTSVLSKSVRNGTLWYYLDDGKYGCFSGMVYDGCRYVLLSDRETPRRACTVAGPTCDSFDVIYKDWVLPELEVGDLLLVPCMGAYTNSNVTNFNGLATSRDVIAD